VTARPATPEDAEAIARIYNQGIEDRVATFEMRLRTAADIRPGSMARIRLSWSKRTDR